MLRTCGVWLNEASNCSWSWPTAPGTSTSMRWPSSAACGQPKICPARPLVDNIIPTLSQTMMPMAALANTASKRRAL